MGAYRVTDAAKQDFRAILKETREQFGTHQRQIYKGLIATAVKMVATEPGRGGSWDRGGIVPGLRAFHLENAAGRRGAAAHTLYYAVEHLPAGSPRVVILRLLHEGMEPNLHIARTDFPDSP
ncbi:toxin ParE1/3/4 [Azospirillum lipoferum]|uniref:Type II toxin-antitoxin system RelE/ParE family toxin n=1 Tax=Azospirillum lipoferum TaxID=193 RepID=A0A5A9GXI8_AZOLI|nr:MULTISPECIES: type II toxin-antitoxin system RelE/ParE family toxin [Azospirillum]KAA0598492.1 type II toxin-antitoxin system RelE/ParE family toxin [Azospirillum lipoferum]MCP1609510.1 toxin ParE1/3/4 [Azospirillum lipoferum]MDW5535181.1 type II toxin-antitoxin system RelE/ParE family toxin [Azospirillum sp. NL1]